MEEARMKKDAKLAEKQQLKMAAENARKTKKLYQEQEKAQKMEETRKKKDAKLAEKQAAEQARKTRKLYQEQQKVQKMAMKTLPTK